MTEWTAQEVADRLKGLFDVDTSAGESLVAAASVLATYDPATLKPYGAPAEDADAARHDLLACSEPVHLADGRTCWALTRDARRDALQRLIARGEIAAALAANPGRDPDLLQLTLEMVLTETPSLPPRARTEEVRAFQIVADWLSGLVPGLPDQKTLRPLADRATQLEPFRELVGEYFAGRTGELDRLADYTDILGPSGAVEAVHRVVRSVFSIVQEPPLFVFGPGGIGKSTLVARFILNHVDDPAVPQFPYAYLDLDRPGLVAEEPITLLIEALRQLAAQYPDARGRLTALQREWTAKISGSATSPLKAAAEKTQNAAPGPALSAAPHEEGTSAPTKRFEAIWSKLRLGERDYYVETFAHAVRELHPGSQPMLLVIDTFEEVQLRSAAHVSSLFFFLDQLQRQIPFLRTVLCGRVVPVGYTVKELELKTFDLEAATAYLTARVRIDRATAETVARSVTGSPLALKLAADLLRKELAVPGGLSSLDAVIGKLQKGSVEAQLYTRVLEHIVDPEVKKLAHPGLALRRITPEIIQQVLAGPCGLTVPDLDAARRLFEKLRKEVVLVSERSHDVLVHRPELRAVMLRPLLRDQRDKVRDIHEAAVRYYEAQPPDPESRAEEIYHRLCLPIEAPAVDRATLERRWLPGMDRYLASALPELSPKAQGFLAARLDVTIDAAIWKGADREDWERYAEREVSEYLRIGRLDDAETLLSQRSGYVSVELKMLRVETYARTGHVEEARKIAFETLAQVPQDSDAARSLRDLLGAAMDAARQFDEQAARKQQFSREDAKTREAESARPRAAEARAPAAAAPPKPPPAAPAAPAAEPAHVRAVGEALGDAFTRVEDLLDLLARFRLAERIGTLPPVSALPTGREALSLAVIVAARAATAGQLAPLILAARRAKPDNGRLWAVADDMGLLARNLSDLADVQQTILAGRQLGDLRAELTRRESQICAVFVDTPGGAFSTGFLVGPDLVLTSAAIVQSPNSGAAVVDESFAARLLVRFDAWTTDTDVTMPGVEGRLAKQNALAALSLPPEIGGNGLGYVLLRLGEPAGMLPGADKGRRGWMTLDASVRASAKTPVATLRLDSRRALIFSMSATGMREYTEQERRLRYEIEGDVGGSGSPIFDEQLRVAALHVARADTGWIGALTSRQLREGIPTHMIVRDLAARGISLPGRPAVA